MCLKIKSWKIVYDTIITLGEKKKKKTFFVKKLMFIFPESEESLTGGPVIPPLHFSRKSPEKWKK